MRKKTFLWGIIALLCLSSAGCSSDKKVDFIHIIHTTDVHGNLFPYDFVNDCPNEGSYARVSSYIKQVKHDTDEVVLLDAGDILQGQPTAYYFNYINALAPHVFATTLNQMGYDAITLGNHDIETGHSVYDRFVKQLNMPALAANIVSEDTGECYFKPYTIIHRGGRKIAVIGTIETGLVNNLPEKLWQGLKFEDQVETIRKYLPEILKENPDVVIALVHSGVGSTDNDPKGYAENEGYKMAQELPELDIILMGHDHRETLDSVPHDNGRITYLLNPANNATAVSHTTVYFGSEIEGRPSLRIVPRIVHLDSIEPDPALLLGLESQETAVRSFVSQPVGKLTQNINARSAFFGPSTFTDLIHQLQFSIYPQADISITAPLDFNVSLSEGDIAMRDLFKLYRYENSLYLMSLTGKEVQRMLEESYDRWISTMSSPDDPLIQIDKKRIGGQYLPTTNSSYNFDAASGMSYIVDVTKPYGNRIVISSVGDNPFDPDKNYLVAVNSYRGNGGGGLLTKGAKIPKDELKQRIVETTDHDLRYYLIDFFKTHNPYTPVVNAHWSFEPKEWTEPALKRDSILLFSSFDRHE